MAPQGGAHHRRSVAAWWWRVQLLSNPSAYAEFKTLAILDVYKTVIDIVFPAFGTPFIVAIAIGQILAGTLLLVGGKWLPVGAILCWHGRKPASV